MLSNWATRGVEALRHGLMEDKSTLRRGRKILLQAVLSLCEKAFCPEVDHSVFKLCDQIILFNACVARPYLPQVSIQPGWWNRLNFCSQIALEQPLSPTNHMPLQSLGWEVSEGADSIWHRTVQGNRITTAP